MWRSAVGEACFHRADELIQCPNGRDVRDPRRACHRRDIDRPGAERRHRPCLAGGDVALIVKDDYAQVRRRGLGERAKDAEIEQDAAVAVKREYRAVRQREREADRVGRYHAHANEVQISLARAHMPQFGGGVCQVRDYQFIAEQGNKSLQAVVAFHGG